MTKFFLGALVAAVCAGSAYAGAIIPVTFDRDSGSVTDYEMRYYDGTYYTKSDIEGPGGSGIDHDYLGMTGTWSDQSGFEASFVASPLYYDHPAATIDRLFRLSGDDGYAFLGPCLRCHSDYAVLDSMIFRRADGGVFDLLSFEIGRVSNAVSHRVEYTPYAAGGTLDHSGSIRVETAPSIYNNLLFEGMKADGSLVSFYHSTHLPESLTPPFPADLFTDLVSVGVRPVIDFEVNTSLLLAAMAYTLPEPLGGLFATCPPEDILDCTLDTPAGVFRARYFDNLFSAGNWTVEIELDSLTFAADGLTLPAPVPLPASGLLFLAGGGVLGGLRLIRRRAA